MNKINISAVSYTNSMAFIFGLENSSIIHKINLQKDIPTICAEKLIQNQVDIGLIPIAALPLVPQAEIIGEYCISSNGAVNSVFVLSNKPINEIKTIRLDSHSRTSNNLTKVLFHYYYEQEISYISPQEIEDKVEPDAFVLIGDRTFGQTCKYKTVLDLGEIWKAYTGLPFVYAAWVSNKKLGAQFIQEFNAALKFGLAHLDEIINQLDPIESFDFQDYFYDKLEFDLNDSKHKAISLFLNKVNGLPYIYK